MVLRVDDHWQVVYTASAGGGDPVFARTSDDLVHWSASRWISFGGSAGGVGESPFVVHRPALDAYFLFRTHAYGADAATDVYESSDPLDFGIDDDRDRIQTLPISSPEIIDDDGTSYIAAFKPNTDGIRISHLDWR
jgi:hypothetical protein